MDIASSLAQSQWDAGGSPARVTIPVGGFPALSAELYGARLVGAPSLLWLPAMGVPAPYYRKLGAALAERGITVLVLELRGQGDSQPRSGRESDYGYQHLCEVDTAAAVEALREASGGGPTFLGGHSLGGHIAVLHAAHAVQKPDGVVLVAAQNPYFRGYSGLGRLRMLLAPPLMVAITRVWGYWPGDRFGFGGRQPKRLIEEWAEVCRTGQWPSSGEWDHRAAMSSVHFPLLAVSIEGDPDAPAAAVDRLCSQLPACDVKRCAYRPERSAASGHLRWARAAADPIAERVAGWVLETAEQGGIDPTRA